MIFILAIITPPIQIVFDPVVKSTGDLEMVSGDIIHLFTIDVNIRIESVTTVAPCMATCWATLSPYLMQEGEDTVWTHTIIQL